METTAEIIAETLHRHQFRYKNEKELQAGIAIVLSSLGIKFQREITLGPKDKIDFLVKNGIGIEVKTNGALAAVTRQLWRYADYKEIQTLVLVTTRYLHRNLPFEMKGKPLVVVYLTNYL